MESSIREMIAIARQRPAAIEQAVADTPDDVIWARPTPTANPLGNLVLHVAGNLAHYVARGIGGLPYERDRPAEFNASGLSKSALLERFRTAFSQSVSAVEAEADLDAPWPGPEFEGRTRGAVACRSLEHLGYHTGQIVLLSRLLTGTPRSPDAPAAREAT